MTGPTAAGGPDSGPAVSGDPHADFHPGTLAPGCGPRDHRARGGSGPLDLSRNGVPAARLQRLPEEGEARHRRGRGGPCGQGPCATCLTCSTDCAVSPHRGERERTSARPPLLSLPPLPPLLPQLPLLQLRQLPPLLPLRQLPPLLPRLQHSSHSQQCRSSTRRAKWPSSSQSKGAASCGGRCWRGVCMRICTAAEHLAITNNPMPCAQQTRAARSACDWALLSNQQGHLLMWKVMHWGAAVFADAAPNHPRTSTLCTQVVGHVHVERACRSL
jgi:hypothetical protein